MINALGAEVDRLEADVAKLCPGIRHIDLVSVFIRAMPVQSHIGCDVRLW